MIKTLMKVISIFVTRVLHRLVRWDIICQPKDQGGLGILNIDVQNRCLLSKWLFKLINEETYGKVC
jgi:hypothetical protein